MINITNAYCLNEIGGREQNEDSVWPIKGAYSKGDRLFMVCDGVGGNSYGEVASALTCEGFANYFQRHLPQDKTPDCRFVEDARSYVMQQFRRHIAAKPGASNMSSTLTLAYVADNSVFIAWCGDSRVYLVRNGNIVFQSEDHSLVNELIRRGDLTKEEAKSHPQKNIILRAIQYKETYAPIDCVELTDVRESDYILLCSDGLLENIGVDELKYLLSDIPGDRILAETQRLCKGTTRDNYSLYLVRLSGVPNKRPPAAQKRKRRTVSLSLYGVSMVAVALISFITAKQFSGNSSIDSPKPVVGTQNSATVSDKKVSEKPTTGISNNVEEHKDRKEVVGEKLPEQMSTVEQGRSAHKEIAPKEEKQPGNKERLKDQIAAEREPKTTSANKKIPAEQSPALNASEPTEAGTDKINEVRERVELEKSNPEGNKLTPPSQINEEKNDTSGHKPSVSETKKKPALQTEKVKAQLKAVEI